MLALLENGRHLNRLPLLLWRIQYALSLQLLLPLPFLYGSIDSFDIWSRHRGQSRRWLPNERFANVRPLVIDYLVEIDLLKIHGTFITLFWHLVGELVSQAYFGVFLGPTELELLIIVIYGLLLEIFVTMGCHHPHW